MSLTEGRSFYPAEAAFSWRNAFVDNKDITEQKEDTIPTGEDNFPPPIHPFGKELVKPEDLARIHDDSELLPLPPKETGIYAIHPVQLESPSDKINALSRIEHSAKESHGIILGSYGSPEAARNAIEQVSIKMLNDVLSLLKASGIDDVSLLEAYAQEQKEQRPKSNMIEFPTIPRHESRSTFDSQYITGDED